MKNLEGEPISLQEIKNYFTLQHIHGGLKLESVNASVELMYQQFMQVREQLAEARAKIARQEEEIRILAAQRQDKQAQLTEALALLTEARNEMWSADRETPDFYKRRLYLTEKVRAFLQE